MFSKTPMTNAQPSSSTSPARKPWAAALNPANLAKHKAFADVKVRHPKMQAVVEELRALLMARTDSNIILITGATGVGKTTLSKELSRLCADMYKQVLEDDPSAIPAVWVEAYANGDHHHGFRSLYQDIREELLEPAANRKAHAEVVNGRLIMKPQARTTIDALRNVVQAGLRERKTIVCAIDEAYHLLRFASETAVMETLKSLANTTGVKFVLIGSFDLFDLVAEHGQVARRSMVINFDRYHLDDEADRAAFRKVVKGLQAAWPCDEVPNFVAISDELMEACLGCVGLLKSLMLDAAAMQMTADGKWRGAFLAKAAKSNGLRDVIRREIETGEKKVRDAVMGVCLWNDKKLAEMEARMGAVPDGRAAAGSTKQVGVACA